MAGRLFGRFPPVAELDGSTHQLLDVSLSGIAVAAERFTEAPVEPGAEVPVKLKLGEHVLYEGRGKVTRIEPQPMQAKIAIHLVTGTLDIPAAVKRHREFLLRRALEAERGSDERRVAPAYRALCADMLHLLRGYRATLEGTLPPDGGPDGVDPMRLDDALDLCESKLLPEWRELWFEANRRTRPLLDDLPSLRAAKRYTELVLTPEFLLGPIWRRGYEKPLGYPGDFGFMTYVYEWRREGDGPYAKLLHRLGLDVGECIANRMVMSRQMIAAEFARASAGRMLKIANVGCGPAWEVASLLENWPGDRAGEFSLIDQDERALARAYERAYPLTLPLQGRAALRCLQVSFLDLMKAGALFRSLPPQDLVYSVGVVDYLSPKRARQFVTDLFAQLAPGGLLAIANVKDCDEAIMWPLEFIGDWSLIYRSEAEMRAMAAGLGHAGLEIKADATGRVLFLLLRKPA